MGGIGPKNPIHPRQKIYVLLFPPKPIFAAEDGNFLYFNLQKGKILPPQEIF